MSEFEKKYIFRDTLLEYLRQLPVLQGDVLLVQADFTRMPKLISGANALFSCLKEIAGKTGTIIVPAFTYENLDPACLDYPYELWEGIRKNMIGYDARKSLPDCCSDLALEMLPFSSRTQHPVYSFLFWGECDPSWKEQSLDYPISFQHVLKPFLEKPEHAHNLLIGVPIEKSLLVQALGHEKNLESSRIQRAAQWKKDRNVAKTFLISEMNEEQKEECLEECIVRQVSVQDDWIYSISLNTSRASKLATLDMVLDTSDLKLFN